MHVFGNKRDIIIVTGCNAVGKTTASNYLRKFASLHNISYENRMIADSQCLFEAMQFDDQTGGLHHTHDWCITNSNSHSHTHDQNQPVFPFTVTNNILPEKMRYDFFQKLSELQPTGKFWFVEWAGGVNTNQDSSIDYSYAQMRFLLEEKKLPNRWLKRVKTVIHVTADEEVRLALNKQRSVPFSARPEAIENGTAFWQKDERVLRFYGKDDFAEIKDLLEAHNIDIHTIENNGDTSFYHKLPAVADEIFATGKTPITKFLSGLATNSKISIIYMQILLRWSRLKHPKDRKQQETQSLTVTEPVKEKAPVHSSTLD